MDWLPHVLQWIRQPTQLLDLTKPVAKPPVMPWRDVTQSISDGRTRISMETRHVTERTAVALNKQHALCLVSTYLATCGAEELWADHVLVDGDGLFAGVRCPSAAGDDGDASLESGEPVCVNWISTNRTSNQCDICSEWSGGSSSSVSANVRTCLIWEKTSETGISSCQEYAPSALQLQQREAYQEFLQEKWSKVGVCDGLYTVGTTCTIEREDGSKCEVRDQPCHGGTQLGGVAGVLSAGWQMTFGTAEVSLKIRLISHLIK
jgi:hypothetical protein